MIKSVLQSYIMVNLFTMALTTIIGGLVIQFYDWWLIWMIVGWLIICVLVSSLRYVEYRKIEEVALEQYEMNLDDTIHQAREAGVPEREIRAILMRIKQSPFLQVMK